MKRLFIMFLFSMTMSLLNTSPALQNSCDCKNSAPSGTMRLRVLPKETDLREQSKYDKDLQLKHAERVQNLFFPTMHNVSTHAHNDGFHMHPEQPRKVAHLQHLHDEMDKSGLVARLDVSPSEEHNAIAVALTREHVSDLLKNGISDVKVPCGGGTLRLHSTRTGRLTGMEYLPL